MKNDRSSVRSRLVLSFGALAVFTILASAVGLLAFGNGWATIENITRSRLPALTTAHQLAKQSKAIAATAPILVFARVQSQRRTSSDRIADQIAWLEKLSDSLRDAGVGSLGAIEREKGRLLKSFRKLDELVEQRISARIEKERAVGELLAAHRALREALGPRIGDGRAGSARSYEKVEVLSAAAASSLRAAANAVRPEHLKEIEQEFRQIARRWEKALAEVRGGNRADVLKHAKNMLRLGTRPDNIFQLRRREFDAAAAAERILYVYNQNASRLVFAADAVIESVHADIDAATRKSRANLIFHGVFLLFIAVTCVSGAIFLSRYIGRKIGGRLAALQESMEVHASGGVCEIPSGGDDEITRMSGALRTFITTIDQREDELRDSERALQARVADLEDAKRKLEKQGRDLARLARDLGASRDQAEAANRAKSEFLANMTHELRTPLNAIIGFAEIIQAEKLGPVGCPEYRDYVKEIDNAGQHLLKLIMDILDMSKIEAGRVDLHEEPVDVGEIIRASLAMVSGRAHASDVKLERQIAEPLPPLYADERMLKQILVNLLSNAVKFTLAGGSVTIRTWTHHEEGYVFQVSDTGIGMALEDIPQAMTRFVQLESQLTRKHEGTGLGLPLSEALVEMHDGTLDLHSEVAVGTTATVRFPPERIVATQDNAASMDLESRATG